MPGRLPAEAENGRKRPSRVARIESGHNFSFSQNPTFAQASPSREPTFSPSSSSSRPPQRCRPRPATPRFPVPERQQPRPRGRHFEACGRRRVEERRSPGPDGQTCSGGQRGVRSQDQRAVVDKSAAGVSVLTRQGERAGAILTSVPLPKIAPEKVVLVLSSPRSSVLLPRSTWWPVGDPGASASEPNSTQPMFEAIKSSVVLLDITSDEFGRPATAA